MNLALLINPVSYTHLDVYKRQVQLFTMDPDIKTVEDLKGKSVSIGAANSGVYFNALDVLNAGCLLYTSYHALHAANITLQISVSST